MRDLTRRYMASAKAFRKNGMMPNFKPCLPGWCICTTARTEASSISRQSWNLSVFDSLVDKKKKPGFQSMRICDMLRNPGFFFLLYLQGAPPSIAALVRGPTYPVEGTPLAA